MKKSIIIAILIFTFFFSRPVKAQNTVGPFSIRIADMMVDLIPPNFDYGPYSNQWQAALDDLTNASKNGEITHVQMRIFWSLVKDQYDNLGDNFITPKLGSNSSWNNSWGGQWLVMINSSGRTTPNWKRWYFGYVASGEAPLAYGPSAIERIHAKGLKLELSISGAWGEGPTGLAKPGGATCDIGGWGKREADCPGWNGDQFLDNYENNVLLPVANLIKDYLQDILILLMVIRFLLLES